MTQKEQLSTMLAENMQRSDLKPYEQAQGFQMMIDLGCTVDEISEQSGFSVTTVRKRLKMAELDQILLKEVSERQIAMADFDRLAEIRNLDSRNKVLAEIGTRNFDLSVKTAVMKEKRKENLPKVRMELEKMNLTRLEEKDTWGTGYTSVHSLYIEDWKEGTPLLPLGKTIPEFYCLDAEYGRLGFYIKTKRAKPEKWPKEELDKEKEIRTQWNEMKEKSRMAYQLRSAFVKGLIVSKGNLETVFRGAAMVIVMHANYHGTDRDGLMAMLGVDEKTRWGEERDKVSLKAIREMNVSEMLPLVYAGFNDSETVNYATTYTREMPRYKENYTLDVLYDWLISLGYEPSDEETALRDGTHPVYHAKEQHV